MGKPRSPRLSGVTSLRNPTGDALPSPGLFTPRFYWQKNGENSGKTARGHRAPARQGATPPLKHRGGEGEGKNYKQEEKKERGRDPGGCRGSAVTHGSSRFAARRLSALTGSSAAAPPPPSLPPRLRRGRAPPLAPRVTWRGRRRCHVAAAQCGSGGGTGRDGGSEREGKVEKRREARQETGGFVY